MAKLDRYLKQFAAIIGVGIVALLAVNCILRRRPTHTNPAYDDTFSGTWETITNDLATVLSKAERPYTIGEHYFLAPELDQYNHYKNLNIVTRFNASNSMRNVDISQYRHTVSLLKRNIRITGLFLLVVEQHKYRATSGGSCLYGVSEPISGACARFVTSTTARIYYIVRRLQRKRPQRTVGKLPCNSSVSTSPLTPVFIRLCIK